MNIRILRRGALALVLVLTLGMLAGCGSTSSTVDDKAVSTAGAQQQTTVVEEFKYPIKGNVKLTYFTRAVPAGFQNYAEMPWAKAEAEKTGVTIEYIHRTTGNEQFNMMVASNELPDIVMNDWRNIAGGPQKAINDKLIIPLKEAIEKYAPNFKKALKTYEGLDKHVKTDSGEYYTFPMVRTADELVVFEGLLLRKDWLDELGLKVPETIDEWYTVLKAFKQKGIKAPLTYYPITMKGAAGRGAFAGAYGTTDSFYVENGKVKYGPFEPAYKDYLATMAKWYKEGLIDPDVGTVDRKLAQTKMLDNSSGAMYGLVGGDMGGLFNSTAKKDPKYDLVAAPYPVLKKGEKPKFGHRDYVATDSAGVAISARCKNVEAAVRYLDWGYSEEGTLLYQFGIEGQSYKMVNGYPTYMNQKPGEVIPGDFLRTNGPGLNDVRYFEQATSLPQQKDAVKKWAATDMIKYMIPAIIPSDEEAPQQAKIQNDVTTHVNEMFLKFMFGNEPIEKYDAYIEQLKKLGVEKLIQIKQTGLERYNKR